MAVYSLMTDAIPDPEVRVIRFLGRASGALLLAHLALLTVPSDVHAQLRRVTHREVKRRYIVFVPASYATTPERRYPVVLHFHGGGMTAAEQMLYTRMNDAADRHGFIVAYPQGIAQDWNVGFGMSYSEGSDDVGFTEAILDDLATSFRIDTSRVYATGLSRGGFFVHRLAAELSHRFAAVASVGAPMPVPVRDGFQPRAPRRPIGVMQVHGTGDEVVMYGGKPDHYLSAEASQAYWAAQRGLEGAEATSQELDADASDGTHVTVHTRSTAHHAAVLVTIHDGGHTWAGADRFNVGLPLGRTSGDIDLNDVMWRFFAAHQRR